jgi:thiol-disulfide isomerase/thioredoxin
VVLRGTHFAVSVQSQKIANFFVLCSGFILLLYIIAQSIAAVQASGPQARIKELMPIVRAEAIEKPLADVLAKVPLETRDKKIVRLENFPKDKLLFVNFWATWCKPCVKELPSMVKLVRKLHGQDFIMIAISYDEDWESLTGFFDRVFGGVPQGLYLLRDPAKEDKDMLRVKMGTMKLPET